MDLRLIKYYVRAFNYNYYMANAGGEVGPSPTNVAFKNRWQKGIAAALILSIIVFLVIGSFQPTGIFGGVLSFALIFAWVLLPVSTYFEIKCVPETSNWKPHTGVWVLYAAVPFIGIISGALYLWQRKHDENFLYETFVHPVQGILERFTQGDYDEEELSPISEKARGESVTPDLLNTRLDKDTTPYDILDEGEQPHYFLQGGTIDVEGVGADSESIIGWDRDRRIGTAHTVITDSRILVIMQHMRGFDEHTVPYDSIVGVNLSRGLASRRLTLQTRGPTYHLSVGQSDEEEIRAAADYLRERRTETSEPVLNNNEDDALDRLSKLKELHDSGALTDQEFEEKKSDLLDKV